MYMYTDAFSIRISRDVTLGSCIVPADYRPDPYKESVYGIRIRLPKGYEVATSKGHTIEVYGPNGIAYLDLDADSDLVEGWRNVGGRRCAIHLLDSEHLPPSRGKNNQKSLWFRLI